MVSRPMSGYLPLFHQMATCPVLVVGGGTVAQRRVHALLAKGARITLCAPAVHAAMPLQHPALHHLKRSYDTDITLDRYRLIIAASDDKALNRRIATQAAEQGIPCNVASESAAGTVLFPAMLERLPLQLAWISGGQAPALSAWLKRYLQAALPMGLGPALRWCQQHRQAIKGASSTAFAAALDAVLAGRQPDASVLHQASTGHVAMIGAGPGDPELLTLKAVRLLQSADVVFYDRLVSKDILALIPAQAERCYVGKKQAWHSLRQEAINQLLVNHAQQGRRVVRLKGGDPFVFGRGGEELASLHQHGIPFQVVPGISAAHGCAAYAGIPLTHRDHADAVVFVTGHVKTGPGRPDWPSLIRPRQTVVVYMGLLALAELVAQMQEQGVDGAISCALISHGTLPDQQVYRSTLAALPALAEQQQVPGPALLLIGDVVQLYETLQCH